MAGSFRMRAGHCEIQDRTRGYRLNPIPQPLEKVEGLKVVDHQLPII
jgi:hypothetical protein